MLSPLAVAARMLAVWAALTGAALAEAGPCATERIQVATDDADLHGRVCGVVAGAMPMLAACHLTLRTPVTITFAPSLEIDDAACFGRYRDGSYQIDLLTPAAFDAVHTGAKTWSLLAAAAHFDSVVVHELVHALIDQSAQNLQCGLDHEYVAYAMQLSALPATERDVLTRNLGAAGTVLTYELDQRLYALSPETFAVRAWQHFSHPRHGCDFVGKILRGETTLWFDPE